MNKLSNKDCRYASKMTLYFLFVVIVVTGIKLCGASDKAKQDDTLWNFTGMNWNLWNRGMREQVLTDVAIEKRLDALQQDGINTIFVNGLHFRLCFLDRDLRTINYLKRIVQASHRRGMKVIEHLDLTIPLYNGTRHMLEHIDWLQVDARYGVTLARWYCFNNPRFQQWSIEYLRNILKETDMDGFSIDEVGYSGSRNGEEVFCGCKYCREKLRKDTGLELPWDTQNKFWDNYGNSDWRAFKKWRITSNADYMTKVSAELRKIKPSVFFTGYSTGFPNCFSRDSGNCMWQSSQVPNMFTGIEIWHAVSSTYSFPYIMADLKLRSAIADHWNRPAWMIISPHCEDEYIFTWAMTRMAKHRPWINTMRPAKHTMKEFLIAKPSMDDSKSRIFTDIGVLFSVQSRDSYRYSSGQGMPVVGWLEFLIMNNIQADALMDADINPVTLKKYNLLIMPNSSALSDTQLEAVKNFVHKGGTVIASCEAGRRDETGNLRSKNTLLEDMKLKVLNYKYGDINIIADTEQFDHESKLNIKDNFALVKDMNPESKIFATIEYGGKYFPGIFEIKVGKGKYIYSTFKVGSLYFFRDRTRGSEVPEWKGRAATPLLRKVLELAYPRKLLSFPVKISEGIVYYIYRDASNGSLIIHVLNTAGRAEQFPVGSIIPKAPKNFPYPDQDDLLINVVFPESVSSAFIRVGEKIYPISTKRIDSRYIQVNVPGKLLKTYSVITIK